MNSDAVGFRRFVHFAWSKELARVLTVFLTLQGWPLLETAWGGVVDFLIPTAHAATTANSVKYDASLGTLPEAQGWTITGTAPTVIENGALHLGPTTVGGYHYWTSPAPVFNFETIDSELNLEWRLKVISSSRAADRAGYLIGVIDDIGRHFIFWIAGDGIFLGSPFSNNFYAFDTTNDFHTYRFKVTDGIGSLFIDDGITPVLTSAIGPADVDSRRNLLLIGDGTSAALSETLLKYIAYDTKADLAISEIDTANAIINTQSLAVDGSVRVEVQNAGDADAVGAFSVTVLEDLNGNGGFELGTDPVLGSATHDGGLRAGNFVNLTIPVTGSTQFKGNLLYVVVDSDNAIAERDEENNVGSSVVPKVVKSTANFAPVLEWSWTSSDTESDSLNVMMTPAVIDLDGNGVPDVVFGSTTDRGSFVSGILRAIRGDTGEELFSITDPDHRITTSTSIAAGDIDGDGLPEIIAAGASHDEMLAFEHDGTFKWRAPVQGFVHMGGFSLADLDNDGMAEIIFGHQVFSGDGSPRWVGDGGAGINFGFGYGGGYVDYLSTVGDIDLDGRLNVIAGNTVYKPDGKILWEKTNLPDGYTALGNFDEDPFAEIVLVSSSQVWLLEHDGTVKWGPVKIAGNQEHPGGAPTVADFDGDGAPEIGVAGTTKYTVLESDESVRWEANIYDRSGITGSSVFDFDGDGSAEVVYTDEQKLYVFRGDDGATLFETPLSSCTWTEYPVIVDVDADGSAEIIAVANDNCGVGTQRGVFVYGDVDFGWMSTRQIWNQHSYHVTNVNTDGTIPAPEENNWRVADLNNYRQNAFLPGEPNPVGPDLTASYIRFDQSSCPAGVAVTARIGNGGSLAAPSGTPVNFYDGDPNQGGYLLGTVGTSLDLEPGQYEDLTFAWAHPAPGEDTIVVAVDDDGAGNGTVDERNEVNNIAAFTGPTCAAPTPCIESLRVRSRSGLIQLNWTNVLGTADYQVLRGTSADGPFTQITSTDSSYSTYDDRTITNGTRYYYQIQRTPSDGSTACRSRTVAAVAPEGRVRMAFVPELGEQDQLGAESTLTAAGLTLGGILEAHSDSVPQGRVLRQDPPGNSFVPSGSAVDIMLSNGPAPASVPYVVGLSEAKAEVAVYTAALNVGELLTQPSDTAPAGHIIHQFPSPGTSVAKASPVQLTISSGPELVLVPDVVEQNQAAAEGMIRQVSLAIGNTTTANSSVVPIGEVMTQRPAAGKAVLPASSVDLVLSDGPGNRAPQITSMDVTSVTLGAAYTYDVAANDPDGDPLTFSLDTSPAGMTIDPANGLIQWVPTADQLNSNPVTVRVADDAGLSTPHPFVVEVVAQQFAVPNVVGQTQVAANDAIQAAGLRVGTTTSESSATFAAGIVLSQAPIPGTVLAEGASVNLVISLGAPAAGNAPPAITSYPGRTVNIGALYTYDIVANDADGDALTYLLPTAPPGMTLDSVNRRLVWTPTASQLGVDNAVALRVEDPTGAYAYQSFYIDVANRAPEIGTDPPEVATLNTPYGYDVDATDLDGQALTYSLPEAPSGMTIDSSTGLIAWTPSAVQTASVLLRVDDGAGGIAELRFPVYVQEAAVVVPDIVGQTLANAQTVVNGASLALGTIIEESSETVPNGLVSAQTPPAGTSVAQGTAINMVVSSGSGLISVPNVIGLSIDQAEQTIGSAGLAVGGQAFTTVSDNNIASRTVIQQTPTPSTRVAAGSAVDITVALASTNPADDTQTPFLTPYLDRDPGAYDQGELVSLTLEASDNSGSVDLEVSLDGGTPTGSINPGETVQYATASYTPGSVHWLDITATDPSNNSVTYSLVFSVKDPTDETPPVVALDAPDDLAKVTFISDVIGTASDDNLLKYELRLAPGDSNEWTTFATGFDVVSSDLLGTFDSTLLENGLYQVELVAYDVNGVSASTERSFLVEGGAKVGNFSLSFVDLDIPVSGIPIQVTRTYDSRVKTTEDFGVGWTLDIRRGSFQHNRKPGDGWKEVKSQGFLSLPCQSQSLEETKSHLTEVRLSDQEYYRFRPAFTNLARTTGGCYADAYFEFVDGSVQGATLDSLDGNYVYYPTGTNQVLDYDTFAVFDPQAVRLTTPDGRVIDFDRSAGGITRIQDANGNALSITPGGIFHTSGKSIQMIRDTQGRIVEIIDPMGHLLGYDYDAQGDLVTFTDQVGNLTTFTYDQRQNLIDIYDPLGNRAIRSEYDTNGRLIATIDAEGNRLELTHDLVNRKEIVKDRRGYTTVNEYDERGNVTAVVDPYGYRTSYTYDERDNELTVTDPLLKTTKRTYYPNSNLVWTEEDPLKHKTVNTYNARNQVETVTNAAGVTTYTYDAAGNLETLTDQANQTTTMTYYPDGNLKSLADGGNNTTYFEYDAFGNRTKETDPSGNVTTYTFDANGNEKTRTVHWTDAQGNPVQLTTEYTYDGLNRQVAIKNPLNQINRTEYNAVGKVAAEIDVLNRPTAYEYDTRGNRTLVRDPDGTEELTGYDAEGNEVSKTDRANRTTTFAYDKLGRLTKTTHPDTTFTETHYDKAGREKEHIDERGFKTIYDYDDAGQRIAVIDPLLHETTFEYDAAGRQEAVVDANDNRIKFEYEGSRRTKTIFQGKTPDDPSDDTEIVLTYDNAGRLKTKKDENKHTTTYEYDGNGRLTAVINARNQRTDYDYDELGNLIAQTDANLHTTRYEYDELGRRTATLLPLGQRATSSYDDVGNLVSTTDFNGVTITYDYDPDNDRLLHKNLPEGKVSFTYTATGLKKTVTDARGLTVFEYNDRDRLLSRTDPDKTVISYGYDDTGNRTSVTTPTGTVIYLFDERNQLDSVTSPDGLTSYEYDPVGNLLITELPNGAAEERVYDTRNRPTLVRSWNLLTGDPITRFEYTLDAKGNRKVIEELDGRRVEYDYDALDRLTQERIYATGGTTPTRTIGYVYDDVGNRQTRDDSLEGITTYTYDLNDRLRTETLGGVTTTYGYDDNGNTESKTRNGSTVSYTWNAENRLISADTDGDDFDDIQYGYNEDGIRVAKTLGGAETRYLIDANRPYAQALEELNASGTSDVSYVYGNDLIVQQQRGGQASYYHVDGLGSTRALSDAGGVATDAYTYDAYGRTIGRDGFTSNLYQYAGEQRDADLGLDYLRARYLDVGSGRFVSGDEFAGSLFDPLSLHDYQYAHTNPVLNLDPTGNFTLSASGIALSVARIAISTIRFGGLTTFDIGFGAASATIIKTTMDAGIKARHQGLEWIAEGDPSGEEKYHRGNELIYESTKLLSGVGDVFDIGKAGVGIANAILLSPRILGLRTISTTFSNSGHVALINTLNGRAQTVYRLAPKLRPRFQDVKSVVRDFSDNLLELLDIADEVFRLCALDVLPGCN